MLCIVTVGRIAQHAGPVLYQNASDSVRRCRSMRAFVRSSAQDGALFPGCLQQGLQVVQVMTLMSLGPYNEPLGAYMPSVLY